MKDAAVKVLLRIGEPFDDVKDEPTTPSSPNLFVVQLSQFNKRWFASI